MGINWFPCLTKGCIEKHMHSSGYCEKCRTRKCSVCGVIFISRKMTKDRNPKCGKKCKWVKRNG